MNEVTPEYFWYDMHCHLDFCANPEAFAQEGAKHGLAFLACTVTPADYLACKPGLANQPNVALGLGMHPWWLEGCQDGPDQAVQLVPETRFVGEVGMDLSPKLAFFEHEQLEAFGRIVQACVSNGGAVLSIHGVRSAAKVLDVLERTGALENCANVFHWFSDSMDQFVRAQNAGCFFSVGKRMLDTRRGRECVRQVPAGKLVLETDMPPEGAGAEHGVDQHLALLQETFEGVCQVRGVSSEDEREALALQIRKTSAALLGM